MKTKNQVQLILKRESDEAQRLLKEVINSKNENDKNMFIRMYSRVQERIMVINEILK